MARTGLLLLLLGVRNALSADELSLTVQHSVRGVRGGSVVLPCIYTPSTLYDVTEVLWYAGARNIFHRTNSHDAVMLQEYIGRLTVDNKPGDVSLTLHKLSTFNSGQYICRVVWTPRKHGRNVIKEEMSALTVIREDPRGAPTVRPITTEPDKDIHTTRVPRVTTKAPHVVVTKRPITAKPNKVINTTRAPLLTTKAPRVVVTKGPKTAKPNKDIDTTRARLVTRTTRVPTVPTYKKSSTTEISKASSAAQPRAGTQNSQTTGPLDTTRESDVTAEKSGNAATLTVRTTESSVSAHSTSAASAGLAAIITGTGAPLYILLLVCAVCVLSVITLITVLLSRRKRKEDHIYQIQTLSQLSARLDEGPPHGISSQSCTIPQPRVEHNYDPEPGLARSAVTFMKDYEYETLKCDAGGEYELLVSDREDLD